MIKMVQNLLFILFINILEVTIYIYGQNKRIVLIAATVYGVLATGQIKNV